MSVAIDADSSHQHSKAEFDAEFDEAMRDGDPQDEVEEAVLCELSEFCSLTCWSATQSA